MNKISSILGAAAVIAIAVVFIVNFQAAPQTKHVDQGPTCVAEVHGSCISAAQFWASFRFMGRRADGPRAKALGLRQRTADGLIERFLLNEDAKRLGITVSDEDVSRELHAGRVHVSLPADKLRVLAHSLGLGEDLTTPINVKGKNKSFDLKTYEKEVRFVSKMSPEDFREYQRQELIAARMRDLIRSRVRLGDGEAFEEFSRERSTITLDYIKFDRRFYADLAVDSSPKAVDAWAKKNAEQIDKAWQSRKTQFLPECRVARHILAKFEEGATDEQKSAAKKRAEQALERVQKGEDFADVARDMSDDTSATRGGDLGCVAKGRMVKPFEDSVFSLEKGKISGLVETEYGFHVIKVEQIAKDADAEKLGRTQTATELYIAQEAEAKTAEAAKSILAAVQGGKSLKDALAAHLKELAANSLASSPSKSEEKAEKKGDEKKDKKGDEKKAKDHKGVTVETHPSRPAIESTLPFNATGEGIPGVRPGGELNKLAFALAKPGDVPGDLVPLEVGYAVIQLKEKTPASKELFDKDRESNIAGMRAAKQSDALVSYIKRLKSTIGSEVKIDTKLTSEPKESTTQDAPPEDDGSGE